MKRKLLFTAIALLVAITSAQATYINGLYYNLNATTRTAEVTYLYNYSSNSFYVSGELIIPETVTYNDITYSVTSIGNYAFRYCSSLTSITIPNSVTSIGRDAFNGCSSLTSVTIGNSVTSIEYGAFAECWSLTAVHISDIASWCAIDFGSYSTNPLYYAKNLYLNGKLVTDLIIPKSVKTIKSYAFYDCRSLTSVSIGNSVTSIDDEAFRDCSSLTSVTIGNSVTSIGDRAFYDCRSLTSVSIGNSVTSIGKEAFRNCSELETLVLGQSIKSIGSGAFKGCKRLTDIYCYAERVPDIEGDPFEGVSRKATVWVPANRLKNYQIDTYWSEFDVQPMSAEGANTDQVVITPDYNTADVIWPSESNADTYELIIKDKDGKEICSLIFNSIGQLQSIAFRAPAVDSEHAPQQTQASGFRFTVTGLDSGSQYSYTITAKDAAGKTLQTYTGTFYTLSATGVDNLNQDGGTSAVRKVIEDGQVLLLLPDGRKLNMQGAEVR